MGVKEETAERFKKTKEITTPMMMDAHMDRHQLERNGVLYPHEARIDGDIRDHVLRTIDAMVELIEEFRRRHWMGGLCQRIDKENGLSGKTKDAKILTLATAGRALITIQDADPAGKGRFKGAYVTLIAGDGDIASTIGIQGLCATREEAIGLLWEATYNMPRLKAGDKVRVGV